MVNWYTYSVPYSDIWAYAKSPEKFVFEVVRNCKAHLEANYSVIYKMFPRSFFVSSELEPGKASYFRSIVSIVRWIVELER